MKSIKKSIILLGFCFCCATVVDAKKKDVQTTEKTKSAKKKQKKTEKNNGVKKQETIQSKDATCDASLPKDLIDVSKIEVIIYVTPPSQPGSDKELERVSDIIISTLEIDRPTIDGRKRTLEELVFDKLLAFEAMYVYRFVLPDEAIDKYINSIKEQNRISDERLRQMFLEAGYTYEEAREQFAMGQSIDALLNFKIRSRLVVPEKDIRDYYEAHPEYEDASYRIQKGFIPDDFFTQDELNAMTDEDLKSPMITWSMPYWISEDEMTDERKEIIKNIKENQCGKPEKITGGYDITKVLSVKTKTLKTFEERYKSIVMQLQEPQYYKMLADFKKELLEKYEIIYVK